MHEVTGSGDVPLRLVEAEPTERTADGKEIRNQMGRFCGPDLKA